MKKIIEINQKEVSCICGGVAIKPYVLTFVNEAAKGYLDCVNKANYALPSFGICVVNALSSGAIGCLRKISENTIVSALVGKINEVVAARRLARNADIAK